MHGARSTSRTPASSAWSPAIDARANTTTGTTAKLWTSIVDQNVLDVTRQCAALDWHNELVAVMVPRSAEQTSARKRAGIQLPSECQALARWLARMRWSSFRKTYRLRVAGRFLGGWARSRVMNLWAAVARVTGRGRCQLSQVRPRKPGISHGVPSCTNQRS
jgi:hypothetical protein